MRPETSGRLLALSAALLWGSCGLFARAPWFDIWPDQDRGVLLAFWRAALAMLVLAPLVRRPRFRLILVPLGASFCVMSVTYLVAVVRTSPANAIWLQNMAPLWVVLLGMAFFSERLSRQNVVPLALGIVGVLFIIAFELPSARGGQLIGVGCGVIAGVSFAAVLVLMREVSSENPAWIVLVNHAITTIALLPWVVYLGIFPTPGQLVALFAFGTIQMAIPYLLLMMALRRIRAQEASLIILAEPVTMPLWTYLVWGVPAAWWTVVGAAFILAGLLWRYTMPLISAQRNGASEAPS